MAGVGTCFSHCFNRVCKSWIRPFKVPSGSHGLIHLFSTDHAARRVFVCMVPINARRVRIARVTDTFVQRSIMGIPKKKKQRCARFVTCHEEVLDRLSRNTWPVFKMEYDHQSLSTAPKYAVSTPYMSSSLWWTTKVVSSKPCQNDVPMICCICCVFVRSVIVPIWATLCCLCLCRVTSFPSGHCPHGLIHQVKG